MKLKTGDIVTFENNQVTILEDLGKTVIILLGNIDELNELTVNKQKLTI